MRDFIMLEPGDRVLDYATWRPTLADLAAMIPRPKAVVRYQAAKTAIPLKLLGDPEIAWLHNVARLAIIVCHESYQTRARSGFAGGLADGTFIEQWADSRNYPEIVPLLFADDTNETAPTLPAALDYQRGADQRNRRGTGPYGDNDILAACVTAGIGTAILWYAGARAWSNYHEPIPECHIEQTVAGSVAGRYDMNIVRRPFPAWLPNNESGTDMIYLATLTDGTVVAVGDAVRPVSSEEIDTGGPLAGLPMFTPPAGSNWHAWLYAAATEYAHRVMFPGSAVDLDALAAKIAPLVPRRFTIGDAIAQ